MKGPITSATSCVPHTVTLLQSMVARTSSPGTSIVVEWAVFLRFA
jgi:hypothetical protein